MIQVRGPKKTKFNRREGTKVTDAVKRCAGPRPAGHPRAGGPSGRGEGRGLVPVVPVPRARSGRLHRVLTRPDCASASPSPGQPAARFWLSPAGCPMAGGGCRTAGLSWGRKRGGLGPGRIWGAVRPRGWGWASLRTRSAGRALGPEAPSLTVSPPCALPPGRDALCSVGLGCETRAWLPGL